MPCVNARARSAIETDLAVTFRGTRLTVPRAEMPVGRRRVGIGPNTRERRPPVETEGAVRPGRPPGYQACNTCRTRRGLGVRRPGTQSLDDVPPAACSAWVPGCLPTESGRGGRCFPSHSPWPNRSPQFFFYSVRLVTARPAPGAPFKHLRRLRAARPPSGTAARTGFGEASHGRGGTGVSRPRTTRTGSAHVAGQPPTPSPAACEVTAGAGFGRLRVDRPCRVRELARSTADPGRLRGQHGCRLWALTGSPPVAGQRAQINARGGSSDGGGRRACRVRAGVGGAGRTRRSPPRRRRRCPPRPPPPRCRTGLGSWRATRSGRRR
jgi:hypothetical protein